MLQLSPAEKTGNTNVWLMMTIKCKHHKKRANMLTCSNLVQFAFFLFLKCIRLLPQNLSITTMNQEELNPSAQYRLLTTDIINPMRITIRLHEEWMFIAYNSWTELMWYSSLSGAIRVLHKIPTPSYSPRKTSLISLYTPEYTHPMPPAGRSVKGSSKFRKPFLNAF